MSAEPTKEKKPKPLTPEEQKGLVGELKPGESGWVALDDAGKPTGGATKNPPEGKPAIPVTISAPKLEADVVKLPSGATISDSGMNPSPSHNKYASSAYGRDYVKAEADRRKAKGLPPLETSPPPGPAAKASKAA